MRWLMTKKFVGHRRSNPVEGDFSRGDTVLA